MSRPPSSSRNDESDRETDYATIRFRPTSEQVSHETALANWHLKLSKKERNRWSRLPATQLARPSSFGCAGRHVIGADYPTARSKIYCALSIEPLIEIKHTSPTQKDNDDRYVEYIYTPI